MTVTGELWECLWQGKWWNDSDRGTGGMTLTDVCFGMTVTWGTSGMRVTGELLE